MVSVYYYTYMSTDFKAAREKMRKREKNEIGDSLKRELNGFGAERTRAAQGAHGTARPAFLGQGCRQAHRAAS